MNLCPRCQDRYDDGSQFCPRDGARLERSDAGVGIGAVLAGQFEVEEEIGAGAMGTVFRARQRGMDRHVAVKVLRPGLMLQADAVSRFRREARAIARLSHPHIVTLFLVGGTDDGVPYLVMEYVAGEPLSVLLAREGRLPPARALRIVRQIASALAEAHAEGVVHRDLKPANVLLARRRTAGDFVKLVDFGIAKVAREPGAGEPSHLTREGTIVGTPAYLSPEQVSGASVDHRADLYSLGVILYELLTGRVPFEGSGMMVVLAHLKEVPPSPRALVPELPPEVDALVLRALEKSAAARFQTADELAAAVDAALGHAAEQVAPFVAAPASHPVPWSLPTGELAPFASSAFGNSSLEWRAPTGRRTALAVLATILAVGSIALGAVAWRSSGASDEGARTEAAAKLAEAGTVVDAGAAKVVAAVEPAPREPRSSGRVVVLAARGWQVRVVLPQQLIVGDEQLLLLQLLAPGGAPHETRSLEVAVEEPTGSKRELVARASTRRVGAFELRRRFTQVGLHRLRVRLPEKVALEVSCTFIVVRARTPPPDAPTVAAPSGVPSGAATRLDPAALLLLLDGPAAPASVIIPAAPPRDLPWPDAGVPLRVPPDAAAPSLPEVEVEGDPYRLLEAPPTPDAAPPPDESGFE